MTIINNISRIISSKINTNNYQNAQLAIVLWVLSMVIIAWQYFQLHLGLQPCPMCISQRLLAVLAALFALFGLLHRYASIRVKVIYSLLSMVSIAAGIAIAIRQLWLQSLAPEQAPACGPAFNFVVENFPLGPALNALFLGDGSCAEVKWQLLGISIPGWSAIAFVFLLIFAISGLRTLKNQ